MTAYDFTGRCGLDHGDVGHWNVDVTFRLRHDRAKRRWWYAADCARGPAPQAVPVAGGAAVTILAVDRLAALPTPYFQDEAVTIYHGDARCVLPFLQADVMVTDPPFGIDYESGQESPNGLARRIEGDRDTSVRDHVLALWEPRPALVFGSWRAPRPARTKAVLIWDTLGALGMGDLSLPWKPSHQEIYVLGRGFVGRRTSDVLPCPPVQSMAANGRVHPHEKPVSLMCQLILKCPEGIVLDPFMGSGTTLRAAKDLGRKAIGIEIEERYCEIAAKRMAQTVMAL